MSGLPWKNPPGRGMVKLLHLWSLSRSILSFGSKDFLSHLVVCASSMLTPHPFGSFIRIWREARVFDQHDLQTDAYGAVLRCKFCMPHWERGLYNGTPYRIDCRNGWWERDNGECACIYFLKDGTMMTSGKRFYARDYMACLTVHTCDLPSVVGVRDRDEDMIGWEDILPVMTLRWRSSSLRFRARLHRFRDEQRQDSIARYLSMRDWNRTRLCNFSLNAVACIADVMFTKFLPARLRRRGGHKVALHFSREQHRAFDPLWVDTVVYLPIGTFVWPAKDAAPGGVDAREWLWVKYRLTHWLHEEAGWMHPDIIAFNQEEML